MATQDSVLGTTATRMGRVPPHAFFVTSAVFHYLGPACAVLLFAHVAPLGVAWLRIASAACVFMAWRRPWRAFGRSNARLQATVLALGVVLAPMNAAFYLAIARLPLGTVGAIEFLGPVALAAAGVRSVRNVLALALAVAGVYVLADIRIVFEPVGVLWAFVNCGLFVSYVVLGHRIAGDGDTSGIDRLGMAMCIAMVVALPIGIREAAVAFASPPLLLAGIGVGICSSVIPYVCDQLAMVRLPRATFALLLSLLPAMAAVIGWIVLHQRPSALEAMGIGLVIAGVAVHRGEER
jgi:inner membrane transporter RhtA